MRVSAATRDAVLGAARRLGYTHDLNARRLRSAGARAAAPEITLAILRIRGTPIGMSARLLGAATAALETRVPSAQLAIEAFLPGRLREHPGLTVASRFHAAIVVGPTPEDEAFLDDTDLPVPVVVFQRQMRRQAWVDTDGELAGWLATRHFLEQGRRRIAVAGWASVASAAVERRLRGYRRALAAAGLAETARVERGPELSEAAGAAVTARLLAGARPDAILAMSDVLAVGALHAVRAAGLRVPADVAVAGFDDLSFAPYLSPPLTSVRLPFEAMGAAAVAWLAAAVRGQASEPLRRRFPPELIVREST
jgi:DNA-binding LacI/PurR family transcriptional regulator